MSPPIEAHVFVPLSGGPKPPDLGIFCEGNVPFRPLGKSKYKMAPWVGEEFVDDYIPSEMSVRALKLGVEKSLETRKYLPEDLVQEAQAQLSSHMKTVWKRTNEEYVMSFEEAIDEMVRDKSPGFPYYYQHQNKGLLLDDPESFALLKEEVECLLLGDQIPCIFSLTEKTELRLKSKVQQGKTRVFMASPMHHLIASKMLFEKQNQDIQNTRGKHPVTIGIQVPGPEFVTAVTTLSPDSNNINDGDLSGCDLRFPTRIARAIRDMRMERLPFRYHKCAMYLYDCVYAGSGVVLGGQYHIPGNKSGWNNTGHDNSLQTWFAIVMACRHFFPRLTWSEVINLLINGDDLLAHLKQDVTWREMCDWIRENIGVSIEADHWEPRHASNVVFLSHHVEERFVPNYGDIVVAAGNLPKLLSSLNWVQTNANLTLEESCVAHLVGIRLCLFPWQVEFEQCDELLSGYLKTIQATEFIDAVLKARFTEKELARLHTRCECFETFDFFTFTTPDQVLKWTSSLIKGKNDTHQNSKGKESCSSSGTATYWSPSGSSSASEN